MVSNSDGNVFTWCHTQHFSASSQLSKVFSLELSSQMQTPDLYPEPLLKIILIPELQEQITEVASLKNHSQGSQPKY